MPYIYIYAKHIYVYLEVAITWVVPAVVIDLNQHWTRETRPGQVEVSVVGECEGIMVTYQISSSHRP